MVCITDKHTHNNALLYLLDILSIMYRGTTILNLDDQNLFSGTKHYYHFHKRFLEFFVRVSCLKFSRRAPPTYKKILIKSDCYADYKTVDKVAKQVHFIKLLTEKWRNYAFLISYYCVQKFSGCKFFL